MKKMISFALALIMVLVLVACGDNPASNGGIHRMKPLH